MQRHRHQEFIRFLNAIERAVPAGKLIHVDVGDLELHAPSPGESQPLSQRVMIRFSTRIPQQHNSYGG